MQYVNDDMDDVFRKAAEDYPLDTSGSDWNKVQAILQSSPATPPKKDGRRFLWFFLLLPLALLCNKFVTVKDSNSLTASGERTTSLPVEKNVQSRGESGLPDQVNEKQLQGEGQPVNKRNEDQGRTTEPKNLGSEEGSDRVADAGRNVVPSRKSGQGTDPDGMGHTFSSKWSSAKKSSGQKNQLRQEEKNDGQRNSFVPARDETITHIEPQRHIDMEDGLNINLDLPESAEVKAMAFNKAVVPPGPVKRFYAGIMGGIDFTTVKFQQVDGAGFDYGLLAGYQLNRRWSVEASAFLEKKIYYTEGSYFKGEKMYMPPNSWITDVSGNCRMLDLSLEARYWFRHKPSSKWFAGAGLSSYLMKKEAYDFTYYYASSGTSAVHSWAYKNSSKNFLAIANLSAGYTHRIGKLANLRVEPYVKIPVSGVGYGKLRLLSGGLRVGLTKTIF